MISASRAGAVALCGALLIVTALAFATAPLLIPGLAFTAIGVLAPVLVWLPARGARLRREVGRDSVLEGERFGSVITLTAGRFGLSGAELRDPLGGEAVRVSIAPSLRPERELKIDVVATFTRRGRKRLAAPELRVCDPLGLAPARRQAAEELELLVLPRIEPVTWALRGGAGRRNTLERGLLADAFAASEIDGLRPYRPGTPASRIHWPALARGAGLLERRMRTEQDSRPLVVLDSRSEENETGQLDAAVRAAASLIIELARSGGCGLLTASSARPLEVDRRLGGWPAVHTHLALLGASARPPALATRRRPGPLFYVGAGSLGRLPAVLQDAGGVIVLPSGVAAPARAPACLEVAGCVGYALSARGTREREGARAGAGS